MTDRQFDLTWFANPHATDIRAINPYAAFDVLANDWAVHPKAYLHDPKLPKGVRKALQGADRYAREILGLSEPQRTREAAALFNSWHEDRNLAFGPQGLGVFDYANLRMKALEATGVWQELQAAANRLAGRTAAARYQEFGELAPHEQAAVETYHEQMKEDGFAHQDETPHAYRYEVRQEPKHEFLKRYMDADNEFKESYGPDEFQAHHEETLRNHPIPHYPHVNRWPLIVDDSNPNYVDDGYHRMHSYMRDGATHIPTVRMWAKDGSLDTTSSREDHEAHPEHWTNKQHWASRQASMYHWAPKDAADDIAEHGLDHTRAPDFNPDRPGVKGTFMHHDLATAHDWVPDIERTHHLYEVDTHGLDVKPDPYDTGDASYSPRPVPPQRLRRMAAAETFPYVRNNNGVREHAPTGFGQEHEPWGRYVSHDTGGDRELPEGWERGTVDFANPLHVDHADGGWKQELSQTHGGATGRALSDALLARGHDAVVTHDGKYGIGEIVDLRPRDQRTHVPL